MKNNYIKPELEVLTFLAQDIISTSYDPKDGDHFGEFNPNWNDGEEGL